VGFAFEDVSRQGLTRGITFQRPDGACWRVIELPLFYEQLDLFLLHKVDPFPDSVHFGEQEIVAISDCPPDGARIVDAYSKGAVPIYVEGSRLRLWYSPIPRGVFDIESPDFHLHKRMLRTVRSGRFEVRFDTAFEDCIRSCATVERPRESVPWLLPELIDAFVDAHRLGYAHSVEAWREGRLVGGVYGLAIGHIFFGESAFHLETDASKVAFAELFVQLRARGFVLIDTRSVHPHTTSLGATEIPRNEFLERLRRAVKAPGFTGSWTDWRAR
jgi:leucyl/phenylalanyl-tRNA--protein transferase